MVNDVTANFGSLFTKDCFATLLMTKKTWPEQDIEVNLDFHMSYYERRGPYSKKNNRSESRWWNEAPQQLCQIRQKGADCDFKIRNWNNRPDPIPPWYCKTFTFFLTKMSSNPIHSRDDNFFSCFFKNWLNIPLTKNTVCKDSKWQIILWTFMTSDI